MAFDGSFGDEHKLIAVIGDEDTVTGLLLAGIGCTLDDQKNFMVVDAKTKRTDIEETFTNFVNRHDIGLLLINQSIADDIRHVMLASGAIGTGAELSTSSEGPKTHVTVLEIPSKESPYDPAKDPIMARVAQLLGESLDAASPTAQE